MDMIEYRDHIIEIHGDDMPSDPRKEHCNVGTMVTWHTLYQLGDISNPEYDMDQFQRVIVGNDIELSLGAGYTLAPDDVTECDLREGVKDYIIKSIYLLDHSGLRLSTTGFSCPWDSSKIGYIYMSVNDAIKEWGEDRQTSFDFGHEFSCSGFDNYSLVRSPSQIIKKANQCLDSEVSVYDAYLAGEVYGYIVYDANTYDRDEKLVINEPLESLWGIYDMDDAITDAKEVVDIREGKYNE
jgi:hypothetical protein